MRNVCVFVCLPIFPRWNELIFNFSIENVVKGWFNVFLRITMTISEMKKKKLLRSYITQLLAEKMCIAVAKIQRISVMWGECEKLVETRDPELRCGWKNPMEISAQKKRNEMKRKGEQMQTNKQSTYNVCQRCSYSQIKFNRSPNIATSETQRAPATATAHIISTHTIFPSKWNISKYCICCTQK